PGTEPESETESQISILRVKNIRVKEPEGGRIYDGTDQIELLFDVEGAAENAAELVAYEARLNGTDAGVRQVIYRFWLPEEEKDRYRLEAETALLQVNILPKTLEVQIPDGWRTYGSTVSAEEIHLLGNVQVTGFVKDKEGREQIPEDFVLPQVDVNQNAVRQWDPMYEDGRQRIYRNALILRRTASGEITGNPSGNYRFPSEPEDKRCKTGSLTVVQGSIWHGKDYEMTGDEESLFCSEDGILWVRAGTGLHVRPLEGSGYNQGTDSGALFQDGLFSFSLKQKSKQGKLLADSLEGQLAYRVDASAPEAVLNIQADRHWGAVYYGQKQAAVSISVPADEQSGIRSAEYFIAASQEAEVGPASGEEGWWRDCTQGARLELTQEGTYVIYVRTRDRVGNQAYVKSPQIVIDSSGPGLTIEGVKDNSANAGSVKLKISCRDPYYKENSLRVKITGANGGTAPASIGKEEGTEGAWVQFADFPEEKSADDMYTVTAWAEDLAGNRTEKEIHFSVNRFGSVYALGEETARMLAGFYHRTAFPVVFLETNIDYVGEVQLLCRKDGSVFALERERDYSVMLNEAEDGWKQYRYTVPARTFSREGTYEVLLMSRDRANNSSDSQTQKKSVRFSIDYSKPECFVTGIEENKIYQAEEIWACLEPRDNGRMKELKIYLDGKEDAAYTAEQIDGQGGLLKWKAVSEDHWQRLQIYVSDEAGNEAWTEEIPFYVAGQTAAESIPPYENTEKSAKALAEEERSRKGTGKQGNKSVQKETKQNGDSSAVPQSRKKRDAQGSAVLAGVELPPRNLLLAGCIFAALILLLLLGIVRIRRKR
ncbi:MAG: Ig-like domain-containing protein, partial [Lachnospiraceae bacterium]|nr:Ig-like domain-containing protein [Lachnospiraceae bacterium]